MSSTAAAGTSSRLICTTLLPTNTSRMLRRWVIASSRAWFICASTTRIAPSPVRPNREELIVNDGDGGDDAQDAEHDHHLDETEALPASRERRDE